MRYHYSPPLNWHRFLKRYKTQCLHLITGVFFFNVHLFEGNNFTFGKALRGHHLNKLKSFVVLSFYSQLLGKSCQFYFQKSLTSISHPIVTMENLFFYFFPHLTISLTDLFNSYFPPLKCILHSYPDICSEVHFQQNHCNIKKDSRFSTTF